jgi:hypothetical protein
MIAWILGMALADEPVPAPPPEPPPSTFPTTWQSDAWVDGPPVLPIVTRDGLPLPDPDGPWRPSTMRRDGLPLPDFDVKRRALGPVRRGSTRR